MVICEPTVRGDKRGYFVETFRQDKLEEFLGFNINFCQGNESKSGFGVLRGLHYQLPTFAQTKLVWVIKGKVLDVAVDIRRGSPTFGQHVAVELSEDNKKQLFIPKGFAHGFVAIYLLVRLLAVTLSFLGLFSTGLRAVYGTDLGLSSQKSLFLMLMGANILNIPRGVLRLFGLSICFALLFYSPLWGQAEVKFNGATALVAVPNFGIELHIAPHYTAQMDALGSFWDSVGADRDPYHINETFVALRRYQNSDQTGWFGGVHVGYGMFTIQKTNALVIYDQYQDPDTYSDLPGSFQSGRAGFYGLTTGYKHRLNDRWALEAFVGGGLVQSNYKGYQGFMRVDVSPGDPRVFNRSGEWALYRGGLMLVYQLYPRAH